MPADDARHENSTPEPTHAPGATPADATDGSIDAPSTDAPVPEAVEPEPLGPGPVFVIGAPRSGTSALAWAIAAHPDFVTGNEADFTFYMLRSNPFGEAWIRTNARADAMLTTSGMDRATFMRTMGAGIDAIFRAMHAENGEGEKRWVDSTPANTMVADRLAELLPDARFVHILRDGRAAVASMVKSGFSTQVAKDFRFACDTWAFYARKARQLSAAMPHRVLELRQERMSEDAAGSMTDVLAFLAAEPHPGPAAKLGEGRINSSYGNVSASDVLKPKAASEMPKVPWSDWTDEQWEIFEEAAGETMAEMGYEWVRPEPKPELDAGPAGEPEPSAATTDSAETR